MHMQQRMASIGVVAAMVAFGACGPGGDPSIEGEPTAPPPQPILEITAPAVGTVDAGDVEVEIEVTDFEIVDRIGGEPEPGRGHVIFYQDAETVPLTPDAPASIEEGSVAVADTSHTWEDVEPGDHTFSVQLVDNDGTPLITPVVEHVEVTVEEPGAQ